MPDRGDAVEWSEIAFGKDLRYQAHAGVQAQLRAVGNADPRALLAAMLESVEPVEREARDI